MQIALALEAHLWSRNDKRLREENDELSQRLTRLERGGYKQSGSDKSPFNERLGGLDNGSEQEAELDELLDQVGVGSCLTWQGCAATHRQARRGSS